MHLLSPTVLLPTLLLVSMALAVAAAFLLSSRLPPVWRARFNTDPQRLLFQLAYFVGLPYLALLSGALPPRLLGLTGVSVLSLPPSDQLLWQWPWYLLTQLGRMILTWEADMAAFLTQGGLALGLMVLLLGAYARAHNAGWAVWPNNPLYESWSDLGFDVLHWGFYRALLWALSGDLYWGVVGGCLMVILEQDIGMRLNPPTFEKRKMIRLRQAAGILAAWVFLFVPNIWFLLGLQIFFSGLTRLSRRTFLTARTEV